MARAKKPAEIPPIIGQLEQQNVLALDLGRRTGWCYGTRIGSKDSGVHEMYDLRGFRHNYEDGERFNALRSFVHTLDGQLGGLDVVAFEDVHPSAHKSARQTQLYQGMRANLMSWADTHYVTCIPVPVGTIKKALTGSGRAKKEDVIAAVTELGYRPFDDNEADAIAVMRTLPFLQAEAARVARALKPSRKNAAKPRKKAVTSRKKTKASA